MSQLTEFFDPNQAGQLASIQNAKADRASRENMQQAEIASRQEMQEKGIQAEAVQQETQREQMEKLERSRQEHDLNLAELQGEINQRLQKLAADEEMDIFEKKKVIEQEDLEFRFKMDRIQRKEDLKSQLVLIERKNEPISDQLRLTALGNLTKSLTNQVVGGVQEMRNNIKSASDAAAFNVIKDKDLVDTLLKDDTSFFGKLKSVFTGPGYGGARNIEFLLPKMMSNIDTSNFPEREEGLENFNDALERMTQLSLKGNEISADEKEELENLFSANNGLDATIFNSIIGSLSSRFSVMAEDPNSLKSLAANLGIDNLNVDALAEAFAITSANITGIKTSLGTKLVNKILPDEKELSARYSNIVRLVSHSSNFKNKSKEEIEELIMDNHEKLMDDLPPSMVKKLDKMFIDELPIMTEMALNDADPEISSAKVASSLDLISEQSDNLFESLLSEQERRVKERVKK